MTPLICRHSHATVHVSVQSERLVRLHTETTGNHSVFVCSNTKFSALLQSLMENAKKYLRGEELVATTAVTITVSDCVSFRGQLVE